MKQKFCRSEILAQCKTINTFPYATPRYWWFQLCVALAFVVSYSALLLATTSLLQASTAYLMAFAAVSVLTLSVGHQALHGALLRNRKLNRTLGLTIFTLIGVDGVLWRTRHIRDHHPHPNTKGHDGDIDNPLLLRLAPYTEHRPYHRYQHLYAPILYTVGTLITIFLDDFRALLQETRRTNGNKRWQLIVRFLLCKLAFVLVWLIIPATVNASVSNSELFIGFCLGTFPTGWLFLPIAAAHLNDHTSFILSGENRLFAELQAETTVDFAPQSTLITMIYGGLNCHLAHHLFPNVASCNYEALYQVMRVTTPNIAALQHSLSFGGLFSSHFRLLKQLGNQSLNQTPVSFS